MHVWWTGSGGGVYTHVFADGEIFAQREDKMCVCVCVDSRAASVVVRFVDKFCSYANYKYHHVPNFRY